MRPAPSERPQQTHRRSAAWIALVVILVGLTLAGFYLPIEIGELWRWGATLAEHPSSIIGVVVIMALLMSFGLPGSLCFWLIAPFHAPWLSVSMLMIGSVAGALGAYHVGKGLGQTWRPGKLARHILHLLSKRSDFFTQCALRILPGFPHSFVNLASGVLRLPLKVFFCAAVLGLAAKWTVYAQAVHGMVSAAQAEQALDFSATLPLILLAVLMVLGSLSKRRFFSH